MDSRTIYSVLKEAASQFGNAAALHQPTGKGQYKSYTWNEYLRAAEEIACGLRRLGIGKGDVVALYTETRAEFYLADLGVMSAGLVSAALYASYPLPDQIRNLRTCDARVIFAENPKAMRALMDAAGDDPLQVRWVLLTGEAENALTLEALREQGRNALAQDSSYFEQIRSEVSSTDCAILYLTSGATGEPKMGLVSHAALVANTDMGHAALGLTPQDSTIAFLPSAHIAQRVVIELVPIPLGVPVWFSESLNRLPSELKTVHPTFLLAPPRVWERIFTSISTEIKKRSAISRKLFHGALGLGAEANRLRQAGKPVPAWMQSALKLASRLVFSKIRERLGGRIRLAASGAAPLGKELADFYAAIGMPLIEGYGLTEAGVLCLNPLKRPKSGSIGVPLPGVEVRLADDNELLIRSPTMFSGYYKDPELTASVLKNGWLHTGDIAEIDSEGYIFITGRKKELIISSSGKKIYPSRIEGLFKLEPLVNNVVLVGDRLPYMTALFTVNLPNAEGLQGMESFRGRPIEDVVQATPVVTELQKAVSRVNKSLPQFEQIRKFRVIARDFSIETGELTPTMKVRRTRVLENYKDAIADLYMGKEEMS